MTFLLDFNFTGGVQQFIVPFPGFYLLEAWGASGGDVYSGYWKSTYVGGYGTYSTGVAFLHKGDIIYIVNGEEGKASGSIYSFNGGGKSNTLSTCYTQTASGGGCTHFSTKSGVLKDLNQSKESVLDIKIDPQ